MPNSLNTSSATIRTGADDYLSALSSKYGLSKVEFLSRIVYGLHCLDESSIELLLNQGYSWEAMLIIEKLQPKLLEAPYNEGSFIIIKNRVIDNMKAYIRLVLGA